jgi:hypothetical protein
MYGQDLNTGYIEKFLHTARNNLEREGSSLKKAYNCRKIQQARQAFKSRIKQKETRNALKNCVYATEMEKNDMRIYFCVLSP